MKKVGKTTRPFRYDPNKIPSNYTVEMTNRFKGSYLIRVSEELRRRFLAWYTLGNITTNKASGSDEIPAELFQILKDDAVKNAAFITPANLKNSAVATGLEMVSFHSNPKERQCQRMFKLSHNCTHFKC